MSPIRRAPHLRAAALPALIVAFLTAVIGQPAHAQGSLFEKVQKASRIIKDKAEKTDSALTKAGETADAVECVADDANCAKQPEVQGTPEVVADSSGTLLSSPSGAVTTPRQCESEPRAPPDSSEA